MFAERHVALDNLNYCKHWAWCSSAFLKERTFFMFSVFRSQRVIPFFFLSAWPRHQNGFSQAGAQNSRRNVRHQKSHVKPVPYWEPTSVKCHRTKFSHPGDLAPGICAPLPSSVTYRVRGCQFSSTVSGRRQNCISFLQEKNSSLSS